MTDQLIPMEAVKIADFLHIKLCLEYVGAVMMQEELEKLQKEFPKLAGVGLAVATVKAAVGDQRTRMLAKNIKVAMQGGFDGDLQMLTMDLRKDGIYLQAKPYPDGE